MSSINPPADGLASSQEGSKFRRFLKRFGRRPSDEHRRGAGAEAEGVDEDGTLAVDIAVQNGSANADGAKKSGSMRSRKSSKNGGSGGNLSGKGKRSDSLAGRFFQTSQNAPPVPAARPQSAGSTPGTKAPASMLPITSTNGFGGSSGEGLASTLTIPDSSASPAPQIGGLPSHEPLATSDLMAADPSSDIAASHEETFHSQNQFVNGTSLLSPESAAIATPAIIGDDVPGAPNGHTTHTEPALEHRHSFASSASRQERSASDMDSNDGGVRGRDSLDNRTMDTGKSRASTKPTTLMSIEGPDHTTGSFSSTAQIAQHRHGDMPSSANRVASNRSNEGYAPSIQFVPQAPLGRTASGTIVQLPGSVEEIPYVNVPSLSRPHPSNNPTPSGIPADNASMLTLASSTAAASIGGGATSSRGHSHATPSLGGARSIGGSLMGERRNSSDTYASVKALPPLSRRGSDSSSRTGRSIAASATGRSSAQAMMGTAGPGAPTDRISLHRTPSQRTVATQLSIPISSSVTGVADSTAVQTHADQLAAA